MITGILTITEGAKKMLELDPHGWTLSIVAISVVFSCLLILFGIYSLSGAFFSGKFNKRKPKKSEPGAEVAAAIAMALEAEVSDEDKAAVAIALHLYLSECRHDVESGIITMKPAAGSSWGSKERNFRTRPSK